MDSPDRSAPREPEASMNISSRAPSEMALRKVNLGSGGQPLAGYINVDRNPHALGVDLVHDLNAYPWPFESGSIEEVRMDQVLEHLQDRNRAVAEIYRILRPGGIAQISVPHFTWQYAYTDPTHRHFFGYHTFAYYARDCGYFDFQFSACNVRLTFGKRHSIWNRLLEPIANRFPTLYEQSPLRVFPALTVEATLRK
jgi:SAM-dependent methyltransferase